MSSGWSGKTQVLWKLVGLNENTPKWAKWFLGLSFPISGALYLTRIKLEEKQRLIRLKKEEETYAQEREQLKKLAESDELNREIFQKIKHAEDKLSTIIKKKDK